MTSELFFKQLTTHYDNALPFVVYRKPHKASVTALLQKNTELHHVSDFTESGFVFAPFNLEEQAVIIPVSESDSIETHDFLSEELETSNLLLHNSSEVKSHHINLVEKGIKAITDGDFKKVVLSRCEELAIQKSDPIAIFNKLLCAYTKAFVYCWYHPKVGLWLGATPETLLKVKGNRLETMSLAGTQTYQGTLDVKWDTKELEEQQIVTDSIVSKLDSRVKSLNISETRTIKAGSLLHLQTTISGSKDLDISNLFDIINQLHPTPAVCGFPKAEAKQFILENENYNREFYTGFLGELNLTQTRSRNTNRRNVENNAYASVKTVSNLYVNLRCMQLQDPKALIYIGGGVTKDSIAEKEWEETQKKTQTMKSVL